MRQRRLIVHSIYLGTGEAVVASPVGCFKKFLSVNGQ